MVARVAMFEGVDVSKAQATLDQAEPIIRPMIEGLDGYKGHLELRSAGGNVISITLFDSARDAEAAEHTFDEEMPRQLGSLFDDFAGRRVSIEQYEVGSAALR